MPLRGMVVALVVVGATTACSGGAGPSPAGGGPSAAAAAAFLAQTAAHQCLVQSQVYDDQAALDAAYAATPDYTDIAATDVEALVARLRTEASFSAQLNDLIGRTCG